MFCSFEQNSVDYTGTLGKISFMTTFIIKNQAKCYWFYSCHFYVNSCTSFSSHKLSFHQSNFYGSMFWICDQNRVATSRIFQLSLNRAERELRNFLLLLPLHWEGGWGCTKNWENSWPEQLTLTDQRDNPHHITFLFSNKIWGKEKEEGCSELRYMYSQSTITFNGAWLFWAVHDWTPACPWKVVN